MTLFARTPRAQRSRRSSRARLHVALLFATLVAAMAVLAAPAGAVVTTVGPSTVGLAPRVFGGYEGAEGYLPEATSPSTFANAAGNPVLHGNGTYAIYWDPTDSYHGDWQHLIDTYLQRMGSASGTLGNELAVDGQYTDSSNAPATDVLTFHGAYTDTKPYPANGCADPAPLEFSDRIGPGHTSVCLTSAQMAAELESFVAAHSLPKGMGSVFYLLTPPGVTVCLDGGGAGGHCSDYSETELQEHETHRDYTSYDHSFCSYHAAINSGGLPTGDANTIVYAVIPWSAGGLADSHLTPGDQKPAWECQDGGFDPTSKPHPYEFEEAKPKSEEELKELEEKPAKEREEAEIKEELEGPRMQQPNQQKCPTSDGSCDLGLADLIANQIGLEQQDIVINPLLNGWQDSQGAEASDECRFLFGLTLSGTSTANPETFAGTLANQKLAGGEYYVNDAFNLAGILLPYPGVACVTGAALQPDFTAPDPVNAGELVDFDGMESNITLNANSVFEGGVAHANYATYTWNFGDGSPTVSGFAPGAPACETNFLSPCAASVFHSYTYGGTYTVTLTVTDVGGNVATESHRVTVVGPPPPGGESGGGSGGGSGGSSGSGGGSGATGGATGTTAGATSGGTTSAGTSGGGTGATSSVVPAPVATFAVSSRKLMPVLRSGIVVRYSVNEQVAGHFEVMMDLTLARRLHISGSPALGLPAGSAAKLVIGRAVLVTTKAGSSSMRVQLSRSAAKRLAHVHSLALTMRLFVRNAAPHPQTATVLGAFKLAR